MKRPVNIDVSSRQRLGNLFESQYDQVLAYCARRIGRNDAEDAAADVFAIASRRVDEEIAAHYLEYSA